ncbi:ribonuclease [Polymorphobacter glacialis]|uniref:Ribonuclease n=1 Tax=Sandarakinorhabdus glacialis TaxID=1614636 RepID=A0A916ZQ23_9SPHN|nr:YihY/virulence factor BrkB family protein [Polymorphobacter glacialis]GGE07174.1 ribonuclease [Polymorphobacter glacialis]
MRTIGKILAAMMVVPVVHDVLKGRPIDTGDRTPPVRTLLGWSLAGLALGSAVAAKALLPPTAPADPEADRNPDSAAGAAPQAVTKVGAGVAAGSPAEFSFAAWKAILGRVWVNNGEHNLSLMSAGVAFYAFLSFVPLLAALVMSYGLVADPATVSKHMKTIIDLVPAEAARLIYEQLVNLTTSAASRKGFGLLMALLVAIYGASRASGAIISALNVIYEERDRRGIIRGTAISAVLIVGAVVTAIVGILAASMMGYAQDLLKDLGPVGIMIVQGLTWLIAGGLCCVAIGAMYRFAPDRADARWRWLTVGSVAATLLWLLATLGFGIYAARFGDYNATYGSLGAVVVLLMWLYVSAYAILIGGLINAEAERQTAQDSTTGRTRPLGQRGAVVADMSAAIDPVAPPE